MLGLIGALTTAGGFSGIIYYQETQRAKKIANDKSAADEWKELYERSEKKQEAIGEKLDAAYRLIRQIGERLIATQTELSHAKALLCKKTGCVERDPPFGDGLTKTCKCNEKD